MRIKSYIKHPGSLLLLLLVFMAAVITVTVLVFLIGYILIHGVPYLTAGSVFLDLYLGKRIDDACNDQYTDNDSNVPFDCGTSWNRIGYLSR